MRAFAVALGIGFIAWSPRLFLASDQLAPLERFGFDFIHATSPERPVSGVQIIEMDQRSFRDRGQDTAALWDHSLHAALVRKLTEDGARVVVFDILFDKAAAPEVDRQFAQAIRAHGHVALAATQTEVVRPGIAGYGPVFPIDVLKEAAAGIGMVNIARDRDGTVRRVFDETAEHPSLPRVAATLAGAATLPELNRSQARWMVHYGPPMSTLPRISYTDALDQPKDYFRDKFIFIGSALGIKRPGEETDFFRTPFTRWDGTEAPGVALVATCFLNLIHGDSIIRVPLLVEFLALLAMAFVAVLAFVRKRPMVAAALAVALAIGVAGIGWLLQSWSQVVFPWMILALVVVPGAWLAHMALWLKSRRSMTAATPVAVQPDDASEQPTLVATTTAAVARIPDHQLLRAVGKGAYGEVWLARNVVGLYHAVKIIYRREFSNEEPYEREFRGVTKFMPISRSHPGFVNILHVGRDDAVGCFYCIMEAADDMVEGANFQPDTYKPKSLSAHLHQRRRLPPAECLQLGLLLSAALEHLHQARLIHRDIKPGNIIFVHGAPKLADIGLVTDVPRDPGAATYLGTLGYIAPEGPGTFQADIYSLGKVLYEAFTGLDREKFPDLPTTLIETPDTGFAGLNNIILKACESDPKQRYHSAADLHTDLAALQKQLEAAR